jgi:deazaflavin-dependent oxidoreductase (nitroreductase family)
MKEMPRIPVFFWQAMSRFNRGMISRYGSKSKAAGRVLIMTTIGRRSGQPRLTPLQYEEVNEVYYVASARGVQADWYRNLIANPKVDVQVGDKYFSIIAKLMTDPVEIADFLEIRLKRHPHFMAVMLRLEGLPRNYTRLDLEKFSNRLAIVALHQDNL